MNYKHHRFLKHPIAFAVVLLLICVFVLRFLKTFSIALAASVINPALGSDAIFGENVYSVLRVCTAFIVIAVMKISSNGNFKFGFQKKNLWKALLLSSPAIIFVLYNIISYPLKGAGLRTTVGGVLFAIIAGFVPGFFEETICRGAIAGNMMGCWKESRYRIQKSVIVSGVLFGLVHLANLMNAGVFETLLQVAYASSIGIFFAAVYVRTRNLWGTIIWHSLVDISAFMFTSAAQDSLADIISTIAFIVIYVAIGLYLIRVKKRDEIQNLWSE